MCYAIRSATGNTRRIYTNTVYRPTIHPARRTLTQHTVHSSRFEQDSPAFGRTVAHPTLTLIRTLFVPLSLSKRTSTLYVVIRVATNIQRFISSMLLFSLNLCLSHIPYMHVSVILTTVLCTTDIVPWKPLYVNCLHYLSFQCKETVMCRPNCWW